MDIEKLDQVMDMLNKCNRTLMELRERTYQYERRIEELSQQNQRLRDDNDKLMIDVAFFDGRMGDKRTIF